MITWDEKVVTFTINPESATLKDIVNLAEKLMEVNAVNQEFKAGNERLTKLLETRSVPIGTPQIVCLCGSTRFTAEMLVKQWELTKQGKVVLSWCALPDSYFEGEDKAHIGDQENVKETVDEGHLRKIDLADSVFVLNVDGYIGDSTRKEIEYAKTKNKPIRYLESEAK